MTEGIRPLRLPTRHQSPPAVGPLQAPPPPSHRQSSNQPLPAVGATQTQPKPKSKVEQKLSKTYRNKSHSINHLQGVKCHFFATKKTLILQAFSQLTFTKFLAIFSIFRPRNHPHTPSSASQSQQPNAAHIPLSVNNLHATITTCPKKVQTSYSESPVFIDALRYSVGLMPFCRLNHLQNCL